MKKVIFPSLALVLSLLLTTSPLYAVGSSGFENASFSAWSISQANAVTAQADEPAAISYNPAGIAQLKGVQSSSNFGFINAVTRVHQGESSSYSAGTMNFVPTGYMTINPGKALNDRLVFGIGSDSPFGLVTRYDSNLAATRYTGFNNWIKMFTIKPTLSAKITEWFMIGAGPVYYNLFDMGTILAYPNRSIFGTPPDGQLRAHLEGTAWGWQLGTLLKPHPRHQFGFYFRSPAKIHARGRVKVEGAAYSLNSNFETGAYTNMDLPMNMTWAWAFKLTPKTTVETDLGYTRWSTFDRLHVVRTDSIAASSAPFAGADNGLLDSIGFGADADKDYKDTFSLQLGVNHKLRDWFRVMGGFLFYSAALPRAHFTPVVPDGHRIAFSVGTGVDLNKYLTLDLAYMNELVLSRTIDNTVSESIAGSTVDGKYFTDINALLVTLRVKWEDAFESKNEEKKAEDPKTAPKVILTESAPKTPVQTEPPAAALVIK